MLNKSQLLDIGKKKRTKHIVHLKILWQGPVELLGYELAPKDNA